MSTQNSEARKRQDEGHQSDESLAREIVQMARADRDHGYHTTGTMHRLLDEWERRHPEAS